jgi:protein-S-isoprenylcysteine O-methyltransferase Ste14
VNALELKIPPPVMALVCALAAWQIAVRVPGLAFDFPGRVALAAALGTLGLGIDFLSLLRFVRARTTINPLRPGNASALVAEGLYRYTRNPMYLGLLLVLTAWTLYQGNLLGFAVLPVFVAYLTRFQILPEERLLAAKFGESYEAYRRAVRRWI